MIRIPSLLFAGGLAGCQPAATPDAPPPTTPSVAIPAANPTAPRAPSAVSPPASSVAAAPEPRVVVGTITHHPIDGARKSVDAYLGKDFTLETEAGEELVLKPGAVSEPALRAHAGKPARVVCRPLPDLAPDPMEQAPLGAEGKPLARPGGCAVDELGAP